MTEWRSHLDRRKWEPELRAKVEKAEERMREAVARIRRESVGEYAPQPMQPKRRPR